MKIRLLVSSPAWFSEEALSIDLPRPRPLSDLRIALLRMEQATSLPLAQMDLSLSQASLRAFMSHPGVAVIVKAYAPMERNADAVLKALVGVRCVLVDPPLLERRLALATDKLCFFGERYGLLPLHTMMDALTALGEGASKLFLAMGPSDADLFRQINGEDHAMLMDLGIVCEPSDR